MTTRQSDLAAELARKSERRTMALDDKPIANTTGIPGRYYYNVPSIGMRRGPFLSRAEARTAARAQGFFDGEDLGEDAEIATDPPVSEAQRRAMEAAAHGHSTLGISKKVGEEFVGKDE